MYKKLVTCNLTIVSYFTLTFFFFKQKTAYDIGLGIPAEPLFRSQNVGYSNFSQPQSHLSFCVLLQYLGYDATPFNQILKQNAKREMRLRLGKVTVADVLAAQPVTTNLLKFMRASIKMIGVSKIGRASSRERDYV